MEHIGVAGLVTYNNLPSDREPSHGWNLKPFGGGVVHLGFESSPMPPSGTIVDRTVGNGKIISVDVGSGEVFLRHAEDPPPTVGPIGGPPTSKLPPMNKVLLVAAAGLALSYFLKKHRRA